MPLKHGGRPADYPAVGVISRHQVPAVIVGVAVLFVGGFFLVARPTYHARSNTVTVNMGGQHRYPVNVIRAAFATQHIPLRLANVMPDGTRFYSDVTPGAKDDGFLVTVYPRTATKVMFSSTATKSPMYSTRVGDISIDYGGLDAGFAQRVKAAAETLHNA
jgi:hypothetical protein